MTGIKGDIGDNGAWAGLNGKNGESQTKEEVLLSTDEEGVNTSLLHSSGQPHGHKTPGAALVPQVLSVLVVSLGCLIHGTSVVFGIYAIMGLIGDSSNTTDTDITNNGTGGLGFEFDSVRDSSWLISLPSIGMILGSILAAPLSDRLGRRLACVLGVGATFTVAYLLFSWPLGMSLLYLSRLLMGVGLGVSTTISTLYIAEVSTPETRASLSVIPAMTGCLGVNACQVIGKFLDYKQMSMVFAILNVPFMILMFFIPESPVYYVSRQRMEDAHKSLRRLRGRSWNVEKEASDIRNTITAGNEQAVKKTSVIHDFFQPHVVKPLVTAIFLMFFFQTSGINVIMMFAPQIFTEVTDFDKFTANIFCGLALFTSNTLTLFIAGKCPRRIMLLVSSLGCSLTLAVMALSYELRKWEGRCREVTSELYTNMTEDQVSASCSYNMDWLPILDSMLFLFVFNLGYGSLIWITVVEILPPSIRTYTNGLAVGWVGVLSFITTFTYPYLNDAASGQVAFLIYSAISFVGFLFIAIFVPETRGKTEDEIKLYFSSPKKQVNTIISSKEGN